MSTNPSRSLTVIDRLKRIEAIRRDLKAVRASRLGVADRMLIDSALLNLDVLEQYEKAHCPVRPAPMVELAASLCGMTREEEAEEAMRRR